MGAALVLSVWDPRGLAPCGPPIYTINKDGNKGGLSNELGTLLHWKPYIVASSNMPPPPLVTPVIEVIGGSSASPVATSGSQLCRVASSLWLTLLT